MRRSLRSWLWRVPVDREVDEELAFHVEMRTRELVAGGMDPREARATAMRRLGDVAGVRRACVDLGRKRDRDMRLTLWLEELGDDVRFAVRQLRKAPGFTLVAAATLALGIGANSAIFALVDATLLQPLPFRDPGQLVTIWERTDTESRAGVAPLNMLDWRDRSRTIVSMGGYIPSVAAMVMAGEDGNAQTVPRQWVTAGVFDSLGITPVLGRTFQPEDERRQANVVILSEAFWRSRFGGDPSIVGRDLRLDGEPYTVVGIVPKEAQLVGESSIWALRPIGTNPALRRAYFLQVVGRLAPGVGIEAARAEMAAIASGLAEEYPDSNTGRGVTIAPLRDAMIGSDLRVTSLLFVGVVGFVLLICCANVANLLMARATVRARELAIRSALGAGRGRVVRQLLTESLVLSAIGGLLGVAVGAAILRVAPALVPEGLLPASVSLSFDTRIVLFCAVAALAVGVVFGLAPAWQATERASAREITSDSRTPSSRGGWLRNALVVGEIATAVLLLFGAGLLLRTLIAVDNVDRGYRAESVLTMMVDPLGGRYPTPQALLQFFDTIEQEVTSLPGVASVGWASTRPMGDSVFGNVYFDLAGEPSPGDGKRPAADYQIVSPGYFETIDLPLVAGRAFDEHDTLDTKRVCIVNEAFVQRYMHGRSPIGARVLLRASDTPDAQAREREVVGVARQVKARPDEREALVQVYVPLAQSPIDDIYLFVRPESGPAEALAGSVRSAIGRVDKDQLVTVGSIETLAGVQWDATGRHRFRAVMVGTFAMLALVLAMVGVFGVLAYSVQQRGHDFAVRRALGATTADVLRLVVASAARVVGAGIVIGLVLSAGTARLLASMLYGVQPMDPVTFALVAVVLAVTAAVAVAGPAMRAVRVDPAVALRDK
ncbi:MAG: ADOP family duplicated permease [Vicinamibacterales bacterium]